MKVVDGFWIYFEGFPDIWDRWRRIRNYWFLVVTVYFFLVQLKDKEKGGIEQINGRQWKLEVLFWMF